MTGKPKMIVPNWIRKAVENVLRMEAEKQTELLRDLALGLVDADKWQIEEKNEDYLQF